MAELARPQPELSRDVATVGEAMLRLSVPAGSRLEDAPSYQVHVAGAESNVAYALARVGLRSSWTSAIPRNPLGKRVATTLAGGGVDLSTLHWSDTGRLGVYFVETGSAPRPTMVSYDRGDSLMALATPDLFDWDAVCDARLLHTTGITLGLSSQARSVGETAMQEAKRRGRRVSLDVNYRARLWGTEAAAEAVRAVAPWVDIVICTAEDARDLFAAQGEPAEIAARLQTILGIGTVVLTLGGSGALVLEDGTISFASAHSVQIIDRIGAGDAFAAGLLWGVLDGSIEVGLERGLAMSALKMGLFGDLFRFGAEDVYALLAKPQREVGR